MTNAPTVLKNGAQKEFRILSSRDGPRDAKWWAETCFLVHALSDGDRSTVEAAIQKSKAGDEAVLMTGRGSVTNELYARLIHLGYMAADHETVPEELREMLEGHTLTGYGSEYAPDFLAAQRAQVNAAGGELGPLEAFARNFSQMDSHHRDLPVEALHYFRDFFASTGNEIDADPGSPREALLSAYERLGVLEGNGQGIWRPTREGTMNAPFLLDMLLCERGALTDPALH
ncbi:hypothetical protein [Roseibium salinum]|uniref:Uncharacterized protein n=1 Tax=Roseibium salinum TaxID=1604349 RepID=A0ABT3QZ44_9HYPH|nr:hypothetical protein [Roseibium sp. DSM 29163]MCX2722116.1 hypothetical protein [Roseibium sp. DSM 29163]